MQPLREKTNAVTLYKIYLFIMSTSSTSKLEIMKYNNTCFFYFFKNWKIT